MDPASEHADPDIAELAVALERRVAQMTRWVRQSYRELSRTATSVLARLRDDGPQRVTDLATAESVAQPSMTGLLTRLEQQGFVARRRDPEDRRVVHVAITPDGLDVLERFRATRQTLLGARLEALDPTARAAIAAALPALDQLIEVAE